MNGKTLKIQGDIMTCAVRYMFAAAFFMFLIFGCGSDKKAATKTNSAATPSGIQAGAAIPYTVSANKIVLSNPGTINTFSYCMNTELITSGDTSEAESDSITFELAGDVLNLTTNSDTMALSQAVVLHRVDLARKGSGTGLEGVWLVRQSGYSVVSGTLDSVEQHMLDEGTQEESFFGGLVVELEFKDGKLYPYMDGTYDYAVNFTGDWTVNDSLYYDITVQKVSPDSVVMTGRQSHEVVGVAWKTIDLAIFDYAQTFTSNAVAHASYTYRSVPVTCPDPSVPSWWGVFLNGNLKPGAPAYKHGVQGAAFTVNDMLHNPILNRLFPAARIVR
jgi:hypothetical protein